MDGTGVSKVQKPGLIIE